MPPTTKRSGQRPNPVSGVALRASRDLTITAVGAIAAGATAAAGAVSGAALGAAIGAASGAAKGALRGLLHRTVRPRRSDPCRHPIDTDPPLNRT